MFVLCIMALLSGLIAGASHCVAEARREPDPTKRQSPL